MMVTNSKDSIMILTTQHQSRVLLFGHYLKTAKVRIWIGSSPEILNLYDQVTKSFKQYEYKHLIERQANVEIGITNICEDVKGRVYFGVKLCLVRLFHHHYYILMKKRIKLKSYFFRIV